MPWQLPADPFLLVLSQRAAEGFEGDPETSGAAASVPLSPRKARSAIRFTGLPGFPCSRTRGKQQKDGKAKPDRPGIREVPVFPSKTSTQQKHKKRFAQKATSETTRKEILDRLAGWRSPCKISKPRFNSAEFARRDAES